MRCYVVFQLRYEERIQNVETRNLKLQRDVNELTSSSRPHSSNLSVHRELDSVKERHRKHVLDLEQTIDGLRQQLLRHRAKELGVCVASFLSTLLSLVLCCVPLSAAGRTRFISDRPSVPR